MPRATVSMEPTRHWLKCLPGAYIELRRMSFGELLASQDLAYQVQMSASESDPNNPEIGLNVTRAAIHEFQFKTCVMGHNLEDESGRVLNFSSPVDVHRLDPNVGQEVASTIEDMHNWKKAYPNSETPSGDESSTDGVARTEEKTDASETSPTKS